MQHDVDLPEIRGSLLRHMSMSFPYFSPLSVFLTTLSFIFSFKNSYLILKNEVAQKARKSQAQLIELFEQLSKWLDC